MARSLLALALLLLLGAAAPARDWRSSVAESASGWTFGRPGAPLLVEYASFGCPHCGQFAAEAGAAIGEKVRKGALRLAFRPFLIFPHDRAATALVRCVPAARRFAFIEAVMAAQADTRARLLAADARDADRQRRFEAELAGPAAEAAVLADLGGLTGLASAYGLPAERARTCLSDAAVQAWVTEADLAGRVAGITNTPTFLLNGTRLPRDLTPETLVALLPR